MFKRTDLIIFCIISITSGEYIVDLPELGKLRGSTGQTFWSKEFIVEFLAIPYAEPPIGERRFKPPTPVSKWDGLKDVLNYGRACPSINNLNTLGSDDTDEDCLTLCVYSTDLTSRKPVMFFIHGGGFDGQNVYSYHSNYIMDTKDVVLVIPQYRLGAFGFASTKSDAIPGNVAILDILLALEWVHKYIEHFGGDPNDILIFGQSSGAVLASTLLISPKAPKDLFHKIILQSGNIFSHWAIDKNSKEKAEQVCKQICLDCTNIESINECLMKATPKQLVENYSNSGLTIEDLNEILPEVPEKLIDKIENKIPIMAGTTKDDGSIMLRAAYDELKGISRNNSEIEPKDLIKYFNANQCDFESELGLKGNFSVESFLDSKDLDEKDIQKLWRRLMDLATFCYNKGATLQFIEKYAENNPNSVYLYSFDYEGEFSMLDRSEDNNYPIKTEVSISDDLIYLFPIDGKTDFNSKDLNFAKEFIDLWINFTKNGKLQQSNGTDFPTISNPSLPYFRINDEITFGSNYLDEFFIDNYAVQSVKSKWSNLVFSIILYLMFF